MNDASAKIAWLEELLALEQNSKLFFLLAQTYAQTGRPQDAAKVLQQGLTFHPEHLDARLLLIQCLAKLEQNKAAQDQTQHLADILSGHPEFWNFWAERANQNLALVLRLLTKYLKGEDVPWSEIMEQGMKAVLTADSCAHSALSHHSTTKKITPSVQESSEPPKIAVAAVAAALPDQGSASPLKTVFDARTATPVQPVSESLPPLPPLPLSETERNYYETRTYADLLAEQGEDEDALKLYYKLLNLSQDDQQREDLVERIATLKEKSLKLQAGLDFQKCAPMQNTDQLADASVAQLSPKTESQKPPRSSELAKTLTRLAERLEARGQT